MTAFWINNNIAYAADGSAMSWTKNKISYAPTEIDFFTVQKAVEKNKSALRAPFQEFLLQ